MADVKILLVEDESIEAMDIKRTLESFGYDVPYVATSGEEAVEKASVIKPDLILMDIILKGEMDGIQTANEIENLDIPVIYLTAHSEESTIERAKLTEPYGYIIKPYDQTELKYAIELALYKNKMERELKESEKNYREWVDNSMVAIYKTNIKGDILFANGCMAELFDFDSVEDLKTKKSTQLYKNPDDRKKILEKLRKEGKFSHHEVGMVSNTGETITILLSALLEDNTISGMMMDITQRKKSEKELEKSVLRFRALAEYSVDGIITTDANGKILYFNNSLLKMFGYTHEELQNSPLTRLMPERYHENFMESLRKFQLTGEHRLTGRTIETVGLNKDDNEFPFEMSLTKWETDKKIYFTSIIRNITERKKSENALRESEEKFKSLVDNAADILLVHDFDGKLIDVNKRASESLGYSQEELLQMNIMDIEQDTDLKSAQQEVLPKIKPDEPFSLFGHLRRKDGNIFPVEVKFAVVDIKGQRLFMGLARDITEHLKMENSLKESEKRLFDIIDFLPDATFAIDKNGIIITWNKAIEDMTGFKALDMIGKGNYEYSKPFYGIRRPILIDLVTHSDKDIEKHYDFVERMGEAIMAQTEAPLKGTNRILWGKAVPLNDGKGNITGAIEVIRDITDRKKSEKSLKESEEKYRTLFDTMTQGVVYQDANGHITAMNQAAEKIMGYTLEELQGRTSEDHIWGSIHEDGTDFPGDTHPSMVALKTGKEIKNVVMGVKYPTRKGYTWLKIDAVPQFRPGEEKPYQVYTTFEDITQRKKVEKALFISENKYRAIFDNAADGIFIMKGDRFIECNKKNLEIYGVTRDQIIDQTPYAFSPEIQPNGEISKDKSIEFINKALDGHPQHFEWKHLQGDGTPFYAEVTLNRLKIEDEYLIQAIVRDVTERRETEDRLRESEHRHRMVGQLISDFAYSCVYGESGSYAVDWITDSFYHMTGFTEKELELNRCWLFTVHPEDEKIAHQQLADLEAGTKNVSIFRIKSSNGEVRWLRNHVQCVEDDDSGKLRIYGAAQDITELKRAERDLRESEKRFRALINNSTDLIRILDKKGRIIFDSPSSERILGYPEGSLVGKNPLEFIHPDDLERVKNDLSEVYENRNSGIPTEFRTLKADGTYLPVESVSKNMVNVPGIDGIVVITHPIKERKEMEDALRESEEKYRTLFEEDPNYTFLLGTDGIIMDVNNVTADITGLSKKEVMGQQFLELGLLFPEDMTLHIKNINLLLQGEHIKPFESRFMDKKGSTCWVYVHLTTLIKGNDISSILVIASDITERKIAENELRSSQIQLANAMEMSNIVNWEYDVASDMFTFDDRFYALYGTTVEEEGGHLMSSEVYAREFVHPDDLDMVAEEIEKTIKTPDPDYASQLEHRIIRRDGSIRHLTVRIAITKDSEGQTIKTHGTNQDITEIKEKEEEIRKSLQEKEVLLREIHHRVKNNMQIISSLLNLQIRYVEEEGAVNVLKESQNRVKSMAMVHEKLYQSSDLNHINIPDYILSLVTDLFYSYSIPQDQVKPFMEVEDINLNIETAVPCGLIISELVSNSLKYAFPEGRKGEIHVSLKTRGERFYLTISDNGVGLPDDLDFRNTESLGLQLVNSLTDQLDGEIELDRSHGTEFKITFKELKYKERT